MLPLNSRDKIVLAQYVYPSRFGLVRIVRHGSRWRALLDEHEVGRHDSAEGALAALRSSWSRARLPASLLEWRHLPDAHNRLPHIAGVTRFSQGEDAGSGARARMA